MYVYISKIYRADAERATARQRMRILRENRNQEE